MEFLTVRRIPLALFLFPLPLLVWRDDLLVAFSDRESQLPAQLMK